MEQNIKNILWKTLQERQLIPEYDAYMQSYSQIYQFGIDQWDNLRQTETGKKIKIVLSDPKTKLSEPELMRVLGFGKAITQYLIQPLNLPKHQKESLVACGAYANLLITLFDHFTDNHFIQSFKLFDVMLSKNKKPFWKIRFFILYAKANPYQKLICHMISTYYRDVEKFQDTSDVHAQLKKKALSYVIEKMYHSEKISSVEMQNMKTIQWRHKSALPFLAMGIPAWFVREYDGKLWIEHLRWMYSFGVLIGYIDDAVDYKNDMETNSPNIYNMLTPNFQDNQERINLYCTKIADRISSIQNQFPHDEDSIDPLTKNLPMILISSWFGGVGWNRYQSSH